jgi:hypothetical protein
MFDQLVERRIAEAMEAGAFDDLPGAGRPLDLDDDRLVPEELRVAYRILRNSGFLPPEVGERREAANLRDLLRAACDDDTVRRGRVKLALLEAAMGARGDSLAGAGDYRAAIVDRLAGSR